MFPYPKSSFSSDLVWVAWFLNPGRLIIYHKDKSGQHRRWWQLFTLLSSLRFSSLLEEAPYILRIPKHLCLGIGDLLGWCSTPLISIYPSIIQPALYSSLTVSQGSAGAFPAHGGEAQSFTGFHQSPSRSKWPSHLQEVCSGSLSCWKTNDGPSNQMRQCVTEAKSLWNLDKWPTVSPAQHHTSSSSPIHWVNTHSLYRTDLQPKF